MGAGREGGGEVDKYHVVAEQEWMSTHGLEFFLTYEEQTGFKNSINFRHQERRQSIEVSSMKMLLVINRTT